MQWFDNTGCPCFLRAYNPYTGLKTLLEQNICIIYVYLLNIEMKLMSGQDILSRIIILENVQWRTFIGYSYSIRLTSNVWLFSENVFEKANQFFFLEFYPFRS